MCIMLFILMLPPIGYQNGWPISFPYPAAVSTGLSFADITGNGNCEVITQIMYDPNYVGTLYVYDKDGNELWKYSNDTIIWLPAFGDLDNDGIDEMIVGTSKGLYAFNGDGSMVSGAVRPSCQDTYRPFDL